MDPRRESISFAIVNLEVYKQIAFVSGEGMEREGTRAPDHCELQKPIQST